MNPLKKSNKIPEMDSLLDHEQLDDSALKLEIWENEGGAIVQTNVRNENKEK